MNESEAEYVLLWFTDLESRFLEITKYIQTDSEQEIAYPLLASTIVEAGSLIDTIFKKECQSEDSYSSGNSNIKLYAPFFEKELKLSEIKTVPFIYPPRLLCPFKHWINSDKNEYNVMEWWKSYNKLKHDRIAEIHRSTLNTAMQILCALQQVISQSNSFLKSLIRHGMFTYNKQWEFSFTLECARKKNHDNTALIESKLFSTPCGGRGFPDKIFDISPFHYGRENRLTNFLGREFGEANLS